MAFTQVHHVSLDDEHAWDSDCRGRWIFQGALKAISKGKGHEGTSVKFEVKKYKFSLSFTHPSEWDPDIYWIYNSLGR